MKSFPKVMFNFIYHAIIIKKEINIILILLYRKLETNKKYFILYLTNKVNA